jgi:hypothetical protein
MHTFEARPSLTTCFTHLPRGEPNAFIQSFGR